MTAHLGGRKAVLVLAGIACVLSACGVKNDPVPPSGGQSDAGERAASDDEGTVGIAQDPQDSDVVVDYGDLDGDETDSVGARRNPRASDDAFFLDPLLN